MISNIIWKLYADKSIEKVTKLTNKLFANGKASASYYLIGDAILPTDSVQMILERNGEQFIKQLEYQENGIELEDGTKVSGWSITSNGEELAVDSTLPITMTISFEIKRFSTFDSDRLLSSYTTQEDEVLIYPAGSYTPQITPTDAEIIYNIIESGDLVSKGFYPHRSYIYPAQAITYDTTTKAFYRSLVAENDYPVTNTSKWEKVAFQDIIDILAKIGDLSELETEVKTDLVSAINEVNEKASGQSQEIDEKISIHNQSTSAHQDIRNLISGLQSTKQNKTDNSLQTESKTVAGAINELKNDIDNIDVSIDGTTITRNDDDELQAVAITDGEQIIDVDEINNIREVASGKESGWVINNQSQITGTKDSDENYTNVTAITGLDLSLVKVGDNIYIINTEQPDYWVSAKTTIGGVITLNLNTLQTKVDLTNYVDKTSNETISGVKNFSNGIQTSSITDGSDTITVQDVVDLQDGKLDKEVTQTSEDEETTVNLENNGQDFEVRITENGSVDKTIAITKDGLEFVDNETGDYFAPKINGQEITGITEIELEGESGTLTDDEIAKVLSNPSAVVFNLDGKKYIHNEDATNYVSYSNVVYPTTDTQEIKVIYVNTSSEAVNYKHWNVESEVPVSGVAIDDDSITENTDGEIQAVKLKNGGAKVSSSAITFGDFDGIVHFENDSDFQTFVSQGYITKGGVTINYDENGFYTTPSTDGIKAVVITLVSEQQSTGTLTQEQLDTLTENDSNYIETSYNGHNEKYYFNTEASEQGYRVYMHLEDESGIKAIKSFTITESVKTWVIVDTPLASKSYVDTQIGNIDTLLQDLDSGSGV